MAADEQKASDPMAMRRSHRPENAGDQRFALRTSAAQIGAFVSGSGAVVRSPDGGRKVVVADRAPRVLANEAEAGGPRAVIGHTA